MIKNIKLTLMYDGTNFFGTQRNDGLRTVEGVLTHYLKKILNEDVKLQFASRTDRGVHALGQIVNFKSETKIPAKNMKKVLNDILPSDLRVKESEEVDLEFSARFNSKEKIYFYIINNSLETPNPIIDRYSLWFPYEINLDRLKENIKLFIGEKDFSSFTTEEERLNNSTVREIYNIDLIIKKDFIYLIFEGKSFLRHQIRRMVGALLEIERKNLKSDLIIEALNSRTHYIAEKKVSSRGLFLFKVIY